MNKWQKLLALIDPMTPEAAELVKFVEKELQIIANNNAEVAAGYEHYATLATYSLHRLDYHCGIKGKVETDDEHVSAGQGYGDSWGRG